MKFLRKLLVPSYSRRADYDSLDSTSSHYSFPCPTCSAKVALSFADAIRHCYTWEDEIDQIDVELIKDYFEMNIVGKSQDGGWPSVFIVDCSSCSSRFMIYFGVSEISNSVYRVVIQSIAEISPE